MQLNNKKAIITGGSMGLGKTILKKFVLEGADVVICARNVSTLIETAEEMKQFFVRENQRVIGVPADISREEDANRVVKTCVDTFGRVDILVNNAGIHGAKGEFDLVDLDEWKQAIEVNLYGTVHMIRGVAPYMKNQDYGKIISISGGGATGARPYFTAYAASKTAIVRLTETIAKEWEQYHIDINAIAPGAMNTRLLEDILSAGEAIGAEYQGALKRKENGGEPTDTGADLCVFLAGEQSNGISGRLISAVWDNWETLPQHAEQVKNSDIYTLRRIISKDRGYDWEK